MTGRVLPVLASAGREVEVVFADLGAGLREYFEIRYRGQVVYWASREELDVLLQGDGLRWAASLRSSPCTAAK